VGELANFGFGFFPAAARFDFVETLIDGGNP
jgi:hypothetical protein